MKYQKGDIVRVRYDGNACGSFGVPSYDHGKKAKVLSVGRTRLKVLIDGDSFAREVSMASAIKVRA